MYKILGYTLSMFRLQYIVLLVFSPPADWDVGGCSWLEWFLRHNRICVLKTAEQHDRRNLSLSQLREYMRTPAHPQPLMREELTSTLLKPFYLGSYFSSQIIYSSGHGIQFLAL